MILSPLLSLFGDTTATLSSSTYLLWYALYTGLFALFYIFSSPFTGNRELRRSWSGYIYFSTTLYIWLGMAVAFHLPILQYDVRVPVSLFSPLFLGSAVTLFLAEGVTKIANRWFVFHVGFKTHSLEILQNAFVVSLGVCLVYSQCGTITNEDLQEEWKSSLLNAIIPENVKESMNTHSASAASPSDSSSDELASTGIDSMCIYLFSGHVNSRSASLPMVLVLWTTAISALVVNYVLERISGFRGMFSDLEKSGRSGSGERRNVVVKVENSNNKNDNSNTANAISLPNKSSPLDDFYTTSDSEMQSGSADDDTDPDLEYDLRKQQRLQQSRKRRESEITLAGLSIHTPEDSQSNVSSNASSLASSLASSPTAAAASSLSIQPQPKSLLSTVPITAATLLASYKTQLRKIRPLLYRDMLDPPMLEMVPWYALLTSFTGVDMLIHLKLFVGRFDMRTLQAVTPNSFHYGKPVYTVNSSQTGSTANLQQQDGGFSSSTSVGFSSSRTQPTSSEASLETSPVKITRSLRPQQQQSNHHQQHHSITSTNSSTAQSTPYDLSTPSHLSHVHPHHLDSPLVYDHCAQDEELWFDWMSDCGDGWNSSYQIARVLAQPLLNVSVRRKGDGLKRSVIRLPRAKMLVIGGDLAYPNPSAETYETRFFRPFQCAMPAPLIFDPAAVSTHKPPVPGGVAGLKSYRGPTCFAMPGNHDWFDGLQTYIRYVCCRDWLGGWLMPQERSFFALQLPSGWWLFGLDNALSDDIDALQFKYFASIIERMSEDDRVIICTHEPDWVIDTHDQRITGENTNYLIRILKGKVALRLAGDIHNYTRHMPSPLIQNNTFRQTLQTQVTTAIATASAANSLFRGVIDTIIRNISGAGGEEEDEDTVSGVVDATLERAAESARLVAESQAAAIAAAKLSNKPSAPVVPSYSSVLYSTFHGSGGDGEGVFLEDILDTLNPQMPLLRTQSMPAIHAQTQKEMSVFFREKGAFKGTDLGRGLQEESAADLTEEITPHNASSRRAGFGTEQKVSSRTDRSKLNAPSSGVEVLLTRSASPRMQKRRKERKRRMKGGNSGTGDSSLPSPPLFNLPAGSTTSDGIPFNSSSVSLASTIGSSASSSNSLSSPISHWPPSTVLQFLNSLQITSPTVHETFAQNEVDGALLVELENIDLLELGIQSGVKRKKMLCEVKRRKLKEERGEHDDEEDEELNGEQDLHDHDSGSENEQVAGNILNDSNLHLNLEDEDDDAEEEEEEDENAHTDETNESEEGNREVGDDDEVDTEEQADSVGSPLAISLPAAPADMQKSITAPHLSHTSRAELGATNQDSYIRRNVDILSLSPTQDLSLENVMKTAGNMLGVDIEQEIATTGVEPMSTIIANTNVNSTSVLGGSIEQKSAEPILMTTSSFAAPASSASAIHPLSASNSMDTLSLPHPSQLSISPMPPSLLSPSPAPSNVSTTSSSGSGAAASGKEKKKHVRGGKKKNNVSSSSATTGSEKNLSTASALSSVSASASMSLTPRANESLFGAGAVGTAGSGTGPASAATSAATRSSPLRTPNRSPLLRATPSPSPGHTRTNTLYNNTESIPIPTAIAETINISLPEGSHIPEELRNAQEEDEKEDAQHAAAAAAESQAVPTSSLSSLNTLHASRTHLSTSPPPAVRPPPVLIVSGGGGAFMHPTHVPDPEPILFRGNRYVRACSYPPVSVSRAYALLNLFGFRKQNWRFDMFGGVIYFLLVFSILPICNLQAIVESTTWYDALWQFVLAVFQNYGVVLSKGYVSLVLFVVLWVTLMCFGEIPWPWYKRLCVGTLHALAHQLSAISALVLMETCVELGRFRKLLGQGEILYITFVKHFPEAAGLVDSTDTQCYGAFGFVARFISNLFDVPDNMAFYKEKMCNEYDEMSRLQVLLYYFNCSLYLWLLMTPLVSFMFGAYLYIGSAFLNAHYTEAFSSLRIEGYKNIVRFHINKAGDLEIYTLGLDKVPKKWQKDQEWSGNTENGSIPSYEWSNPSILKPERGQPDRLKLIDYLVLPRNPRNKEKFMRDSHNIAQNSAATIPTFNLSSVSASPLPVSVTYSASTLPSFTHPQQQVPPLVASRMSGSIGELLVPEESPTSSAASAASFVPQHKPTNSSSSSTSTGSSSLNHRKQLSKSSINLHPPTLIGSTSGFKKISSNKKE